MLWVLAVAYSLPRFFAVKVVKIKMGHVSPWDSLALNGSDVISDNSTMVDTLQNLTRRSTASESDYVLTWTSTAMMKSRVYRVVYTACLDFVVQHLLPLVALVFFNQRLVRARHESDQLRCHNATDGGTGRQQTWMLVVVVIVFVVCQLPNMAMNVCSVLYKQAGVPFSKLALRYAGINVDLMVMFNSSINVVIYCFMGRQFRAILLRMIGCGGKRENARRNPEVVPLHDVLTPHPREHSQTGRETLTSHQSVGDDAVCQVDVVVLTSMRRHSRQNWTQSAWDAHQHHKMTASTIHRTRRPRSSFEIAAKFACLIYHVM